ncbi:hypothetical protein MTR67_035392 [Solanum verrucosum]|uniref:Uncharacterized protein n=1 Tax=Solanum verrucosum TaxID=315347 RepID=A0AAF0U9V3_SOLVR|nr:hypothetical protein MTR67_035392 [Solanum verrucosum]
MRFCLGTNIGSRVSATSRV